MSTISETIFDHLGRNRFVAMTGAKTFVGGKDYLSFRIPATLTKERANCVKITLRNDLYDIECFSIRGISIKEKYSITGVFSENLQNAFTKLTGLDTRL